MLPVKPVLDAHPANRAIVSDTLGMLSPYSSFVPTSPKTYELRARHETPRTSENSNLKSPKSDQGI